MSLHRVDFDEADWRPHPFAFSVYAAGVALLAWSVYAYAQMPSGQDGSPRIEPWRPARVNDAFPPHRCRRTPPCPRFC